MTATVSPGYDPDYLIGQVASGKENYYLKAVEIQGEPQGVWMPGAGAEFLGLSGEVDPARFKEMMTHGTDPRRYDDLQSVTEERWQAWRKANPQHKRGSEEYREAKARIWAEERDERRLGTKIRDYTPSTEKRVEKALAELQEAKGGQATPEELRSAELKARQKARKTRLFTDVTTSAPKSVSLLHAGYLAQAAQLSRAGDEAGAKEMAAKAAVVEQSFLDATREMLTWMMEEAGYARNGRWAGGPNAEDGITVGQRVEAKDWTIAQFVQHLSRDEDPQLHIHNVIFRSVRIEEVDKVTGEVTEKWLSIDTNGFFDHALAGGFIKERILAELLTERLDVAVEWGKDGKSLEILGVSPENCDNFSKRSRMVTKELGEISQAYFEREGKFPAPHVLAKMKQHIVLDNRPGKKEMVSREELLNRWEEEAVTQTRQALSEIPGAVEQAAAEKRAERLLSAENPESQRLFDPEKVISQAVEKVQAERSTFTRNHLTAAVARSLPADLGGLPPRQVVQLLQDLTDQAIEFGVGENQLVPLEPPAPVKVPAELTRSDGQSVYTRHQGQVYSTQGALTGEEQFRKMARRTDGLVLDPEIVERHIAEKGLNELQADAVRGIAGSGRRAGVLVGPAGTGKSRTVGVLRDAWIEAGGEVIGMAPSETATNVLRDEGFVNAANVPRFLQYQDLIEQGVRGEKVEPFRLKPGQLVVVDESSMTDDHALKRIRAIAEKAGATVLLAGDWGQMSAVGASGMFKALADEKVNAYELDEVMRFSKTWEREASLRLRAGDVDVLSEYDAHGRLHFGTREEILEQSHQMWLADHMRGHDSVLICGTNETAAELAGRVRQDLIRLGEVDDTFSAALKQGNDASPGDQVQLRLIDRDVLSESGTKFASNRDVLRVEKVTENGGLVCLYDDGDRITLSPSYVKDWVELAYAGTEHSVEGRTVYTGRQVVEPGVASRESLYVGMSRATDENHAYVIVPPEVDDGLTVLAEAMGRVSAEKAASVVQRELTEQNASMARWNPELESMLTEEAGVRYGKVLFSNAGLELYKEATAEADGKSWNSVVRLARQVDAAGLDAERMLADAVTDPRGFADAKVGISALVHARLKLAWKQAEASQAKADETQIRAAERTERAVEQALAESTAAAMVPSFSGTFSAENELENRAETEAAWQAAQLQQAPQLALDWNAVDDAQAAQQAVVNGQFVAPMTTAGDEAGARAELAQAEAAYLDQFMQIQQMPTLQAGQGQQVRSEIAAERAAAVEHRASWGYRIRHLEGDVHRYAAELVDDVMLPREQELGQQLAQAEDLPHWALTTLGPVPADTVEREEWTRRAGVVAGYREAHTYTNMRDAIGPSPREGAVDVHTDWMRAWRALGQPDERREVVGATDQQLAERVEAYRREEAWAPAYAADHLREAVLEREQMIRDASQARVEAAQLGYTDPEAAAALEARADELDRLVGSMAEREAALSEIHDVRNAWHDHTSETRERSHEARAELERRHGAREDLDREQAAQDWAETQQREAEKQAEPASQEPENLWPEVELEPEWDIADAEVDRAVEAPAAELDRDAEKAAPEVEKQPEKAMPESQAAAREAEMAGPDDAYDWQMEEPDVAEYDAMAPEARVPEHEQEPAPAVASAEETHRQEAERANLDRFREQIETELSPRPPVEWDARRGRQDRELAQSRADISDIEEKRAAAAPSLEGEGLQTELERARFARGTLDEREMTKVVGADTGKQQAADQVQAREQAAEAARAVEDPVREIGW